MADRAENEAGQAAEGVRDAAGQWAEQKLILLEESDQYEKVLSALTGSGYEGNLERLGRMDHYGQAKLLEMMFEQSERRVDMSALLGVEEAYGLLFAGPSGCGKMTTAEHLVGNLKNMGYTRLVTASGVRFGLHSGKKAVKRMKAVLRLASEEHPLILLLEQLSENPYGGELYDLLLEFAEEQEPGVFFPILIERDGGMFSAALKRDFPLISFPLPSREERKNYIRLHLNVEVVYEDGGEAGEEEPFSYQIALEGITPEEIAAETEGFDYAQLKRLMEWIKLYLSDIVVRDQVSEQYAYERLRDGGYYKVKGHMVRQAIAMVREAEGQSPVAGLALPAAAGPEPVIGSLSQREKPAGSPEPSVRLTLSEIEQKVKTAAEGGPKDARALAFRYRERVYQTDEFGNVDERLANASDEYDEEE